MVKAHDYSSLRFGNLGLDSWTQEFQLLPRLFRTWKRSNPGCINILDSTYSKIARLYCFLIHPAHKKNSNTVNHSFIHHYYYL